ncbi:MAG: phosphate signaling complex protein PhoU [Bacteroidetes bacterium]|nr:phosphate signaling complex protein PhoU [Bacteroidota bacterium]MBU1423364.1 phosphate signaling complex protein PhoU [Bacteroidota bacterium]MBU2471451.1 phosphate signaling complex protein PhoU [Bacteroidota bacterium]MBU2636581.1 phosphate signaling complex protein PhoU [Bacteroidota bacterium]
MKRYFERVLDGLKTSLIKMASLVEESIRYSIESLIKRDKNLAQKVLENEDRVNALEIEIDNAINDLLALQQPVAVDLRLILAALKINNDLERIGDHAVNIVQSALKLMDMPEVKPLVDIPKMAELSQKMLHDALDSFILSDTSLVKTVIESDAIVDELNQRVANDLKEVIRQDISKLDGGFELLRISRNLERVADLATNIAEDVVFLTQARIIKHHADELQ